VSDWSIALQAHARGAAQRRCLDIAVSATLLLVLLPLIVILAAAIKLESRGPVLYRCHRVGRHGRKIEILKFRKMRSDARGPALTGAEDVRFTRIGRFLMRSKLDEIPQLWNVLTGVMSLVGPRPEDERYVALHGAEYARILAVRPGVTGLSQLAFARETEILDAEDPEHHYVSRILPQKVDLDCFYAENCSLSMNLRLLGWTAVAVVLRRDVAVRRTTKALSLRRRRTDTDVRPAGVSA
jgi:lipopolysaccharide/colanic/teichoic acid biosynthesis glycosyltransferase